MFILESHKQVHDKRDEGFIVRRPGTEFPGRGHTIDGAGRHSVDSFEQTSSTTPKQSQIPGLSMILEWFTVTVLHHKMDFKLPFCVAFRQKAVHGTVLAEAPCDCGEGRESD